MSIYTPVALSKMPDKSDKEITELANSYYKKFTYRRTIRDFSNIIFSFSLERSNH